MAWSSAISTLIIEYILRQSYREAEAFFGVDLAVAIELCGPLFNAGEAIAFEWRLACAIVGDGKSVGVAKSLAANTNMVGTTMSLDIGYYFGQYQADCCFSPGCQAAKVAFDIAHYAFVY